MTTKHKSLSLFLLLTLLSLSALCTTSEAKDDPQLRECRETCSQKSGEQRKQCVERCWEQHQQRGRERERELVDIAVNTKGKAERHYGECCRQCEETQKYGQQQQQCKQHCQQRYEQEKERSRGEQERPGGRDTENHDPQEKIRRCKEECREEYGSRRQGRQCQQCEQKCEKEYRRERGERDVNPWREEEEEEEEEERGGNPYVFKWEHFKQKLKTEHGNIRVLRNFMKQSKLLLGIANYRLAVVELNPRTFLLPYHWDADDICYVVKGIMIRYMISARM